MPKRVRYFLSINTNPVVSLFLKLSENKIELVNKDKVCYLLNLIVNKTETNIYLTQKKITLMTMMTTEQLQVQAHTSTPNKALLSR
jgi:hypothetical protein